MDKVRLWNTYILCIICSHVNHSYSACSSDSSETVTGVVGQHVSLSCTFNRFCGHLFWKNESSQLYVAHIGSSQTSTVKSYVALHGDTSVLTIRQITVYDAGVYECFCFVSGIPTGEDICYDLQVVCQSKVTLNGEVMIFHSIQPSSFLINVVNVTENDKVIIECPGGTHLETNCTAVLDQYPLQFTIVSSHHNCQLSCMLTATMSDESVRKCYVSIRLQVSDTGKSSAHPGVLFIKGQFKPITILLISLFTSSGAIVV